MTGNRENHDANLYDVVILGTDLLGSVLAAVLARGGLKVAVVGEDTHPKYRPGETAVPAAGRLFRLLADRYRVPELAHVDGFTNVFGHITRQVGVNRELGFVHGGGELRLAMPRARPQANLYRQDIDAYVFYTALAYGAKARQQAKISEIQVGADAVAVTTARGETFRAAYLVDTTGRRSPLAAHLGLAEDVPAAPVREVHTHLVNVAPSACAAGPRHHLFDGGYLWLVPFGNHPDSTCQVTSAGFAVDAERFPADGDPEVDFRGLLANVPDAAAHLADARPVQPWQVRNPHARRQTAGPRWCLLGEASGTSSHLLSGALLRDLQTVDALAPRLFAALRERSCPVERVAEIGGIDTALRDAGNAFTAMFHASLRWPRLTEAVLHVWQLGSFHWSLRLRALAQSRRDNPDDLSIVTLHEGKLAGTPFPGHEGYQEVLVATESAVRAACDGLVTGGDAAVQVLRTVAESELTPPGLGLGDPGGRRLGVDPAGTVRLLAWPRRGAPADIVPLLSAGAGDLVRGRL